MKTSEVLFKSKPDWYSFSVFVFISIFLFGVLLSYFIESISKMYQVIFVLSVIIIFYTLSFWFLYTAEIYFDRIHIKYLTRFSNKEKKIYGIIEEA